MHNEREYEAMALASLRKAVSEALERKRRLGQYAVVWRDGRPQQVIPGSSATASSEAISKTEDDSGGRDPATQLPE